MIAWPLWQSHGALLVSEAKVDDGDITELLRALQSDAFEGVEAVSVCSVGSPAGAEVFSSEAGPQLAAESLSLMKVPSHSGFEISLGWSSTKTVSDSQS
ncbi:uncharacterized protein MYCFIDRAFT_210530 [Pseudocercospora fijiensis CIRAD86]|uniref:Uncharacterized protein n=1 Tax=Pseudocercospora fijiensis (strain CIRAD86) TaxID=383855 RepID=M3APK7_PSEFD|nr:uncharacterized protein MYCFIDRAFT_210530 [Pseudocercospora fijiensis CIRAD86]EME86551.1 hypothetical protein MYCFIDRAFT_210530 [Pseudocercospora fijiensis CIRAD86]